MVADKAASTTIQVIRADSGFFAALGKTRDHSLERLKQALMKFYIQPYHVFFEQWNHNNKSRTVEVWIDKLVEHIKCYPTIPEQIRAQFPTGEIEALVTPSLQRAQALAGVEEMPPVYSIVGAFEDNAFATALPAIGICLEWWLPVNFLVTLDLPDMVKQFIMLQKGLMPLFVTHEFAHIVQKLSLFDTESLAAAILAEGMAVLFSEYACPGHSVEKYLVFSQDQLKWCREHERELWLRFQEDIDSESLSDQTIKSYLSPFGVPLLRGAPPRVGYFIGHQICKSYLAAVGKDVRGLLALSSAEQIIERSGYNP